MFTIGIITGSGPEAGIDLWQKVLSHTKSLHGDRFRGDLDAPRVVIVSEPQLGLSMDLRGNEAATWAAMEATVRQIAPQVDVFAIACNTLNWFAPQIRALLGDDAHKLLSFQGLLTETQSGNVGLLAAGPVTAMDDYSAYTVLRDHMTVELPADPAALHTLIEDVKRLGSNAAGLSERLADMMNDMHAPVLLLACTELPLIAPAMPDRQVVDVTDLVAQRLAQMAYDAKGE